MREYAESDLLEITEIWNEIVRTGVAFPQFEELTKDEALVFFSGQSFVGVAENKETGEILGLYILRPNSVGRCAHIANASYAVKLAVRGRKIGEKLITHSIAKGKELDFRLLQFNAVVISNKNAIHLYEKLGFVRIGTVPDGFLMKDGTFEDIILFYHKL